VKFFLSKKTRSGLSDIIFFFISSSGALGDIGTQILPDKITEIDVA
jgi:hypothetical protein